MRRVQAALASLALAAGTIALATPAHAAANPSTLYVQCKQNDILFFSDAGGTSSVSGVTAQNMDFLGIRFIAPDTSTNCNNRTYKYNDGTNTFDNNGNGYTSSDTSQGVGLQEGVIASISFSMNTGPIVGYSITITYGGGGSSGSSGAAGSAPEFSLTLDSEDGSSCSSSNIAATVGAWVELPTASECTAPVTRSGGTLLGWATTPDFPIEIAQRQVDNGWGAYEIFNEDGSIKDVFIPAGGAARVAAPNTLYGIWSS